MQFKISFILASIILANCGGGSVNSSTDGTGTGGSGVDTGGGTETGGDGTDDTGSTGGGGTDGGKGTSDDNGTERTEDIKIGNLKTTQSGTQTYMYFDGDKVPLQVSEIDGDAIVYQGMAIGDRQYNAQGFAGENVKGWAGSWYTSKSLDVKADHYLEGQRTLPEYVPNIKHSYEGVLILMHPNKKELGNLNFDMVWVADFENDKFSGRDYPHQANVLFDGNIDGNKLSGHVDHTFGADNFEGYFFGPEGFEIAGSMENGNVHGIFYGEKNDIFLTDN